MAIFTTTDQAQMRRCRGAQLHGRRVRECFEDKRDPVPVVGYVHAIRPDFMASPLQWSIVIEGEKTMLRQSTEVLKAASAALHA